MKTFHIVLSSVDLGQLLDGLIARAESWRRTAEFLQTGETRGMNFVVEDCSSGEEAMRIYEHFERIIASIQQQTDAQGGW